MDDWAVEDAWQLLFPVYFSAFLPIRESFLYACFRFRAVAFHFQQQLAAVAAEIFPSLDYWTPRDF